MTVSYQYDVASSTSGGFTRLLFKWEGSLYKLIHKELILFLFSYGVVSCIYRFLFTEYQKRTFEQVAFYCDTYMNYIPLSFILGFYVSFVASRWWQQYMAIPWPDKILHAIALYVHGNDEKGRIIRRSMVRYLNLSLVLVLRSISSAVKKRFPSVDHLVEAGFMTSTELQFFNLTPSKEFNTYWIPCTWFTSLIKDAHLQKRFSDPIGIKLIMQEFCEYRQKCGMLWSYDWVSIPLVYTQVVTIATYSFFIAAVVGRQFVDKSPIPYKKMVDLYLPFFTLLQFFFYMGLLKVAEQLINPFGDDDEDFELNWIIDRHMKVSYLIVDNLIARTPPLTKDIFFDEESPELPYTEASAVFKKKTYRGSVANMVIPDDKHPMILPNIIEEGDENDTGSQFNLILSSVPSLKSTMFLNIPESSPTASKRSLSVPDAPVNLDLHAKNLRESTIRSAPISRMPSKRSINAGGKGIGSALMAAGSHQGFMGSDSMTGDKSFDGSQDEIRKTSEEFAYINMPFKDFYLNVEDGLPNEPVDTAKVKSRNTFWMPASLQAKMAMKKKPVVKWRPYVRPGGEPSTDFGDVSASELPPGVFEDECAFMWKTIVEETDSIGPGNEDLTKSNCKLTQKELLAKSCNLNNCSGSWGSRESLIEMIPPFKTFSRNGNAKIQRLKRTHHKFKGRTRHGHNKHYYKSLPVLTDPRCGHLVMNSKLLKSLSLASNFLDAVSYQLHRRDLATELSEIKKDSKSDSRRSVLVRSTKLPSPAMGKSNSA